MKNKIENIYQSERSVSINNTRKIIEAFLKKADFNVEWLISDEYLEVSFVNLFNREGVQLSSGSGKGFSHRIGAICEALEHYFNDRKSWTSKLVNIDELISQPYFKRDYYLQALGLEKSGEFLHSEVFLDLISKNRVSVPAGYVNPGIYSHMIKPSRIEVAVSKFSTNNGASLGLTITDSLLHGFNEVVERHYESLLYQDIIGLITNIEWHKVSSVTLHEYMGKSRVVNERYGKFDCYYTTTKFETWVVFAISREQGSQVMAALGAGSSISFELALQRAIDELCQTSVLRELLTEKDNENILQEDDAYDILKSNIGLKCLITLEDKNMTSVVKGSAKDILCKEPKSFQNTESQLESITKSLFINGYNPLFQVSMDKNGVVLAQAFVPEFDKFFVIRKGSLVAPMHSYI